MSVNMAHPQAPLLREGLPAKMEHKQLALQRWLVTVRAVNGPSFFRWVIPEKASSVLEFRMTTLINVQTGPACAHHDHKGTKAARF